MKEFLKVSFKQTKIFNNSTRFTAAIDTPATGKFIMWRSILFTSTISSCVSEWIKKIGNLCTKLQNEERCWQSLKYIQTSKKNFLFTWIINH